jgi:hypothetical protein
MTLWSKPASEINFADVDAFCQTMQEEGARLDYKGIQFPSDLGKTIAAFANTLGGLILLGIDADKTSNKPIWPPTHGMKSEPGLSERVVQIAQDAIYPPVRVAVSNVIPNESLPGNAIVVIRVAEARFVVDRLRLDYNHRRPHSSLIIKPPRHSPPSVLLRLRSCFRLRLKQLLRSSSTASPHPQRLSFRLLH